MADELENLTGVVEGITYRNEANGYAVIEVKTGDEFVTVVGVLGDITVGEQIVFQGEWTMHPNFGRQFKSVRLTRSRPADASGMHRFLASGIIKGIGEATATKIVEKFGSSTFNVIENEPERLAEIKGISKSKAKRISKDFKMQFAARDVMNGLAELGFNQQEAYDIYSVLKSDSLDIVNENPYALVSLVGSIDFARADEKDKQWAYLQFERYQAFSQMLKDRDVPIAIHHCSNSAGIYDMPEANMDLVRAGISIYGMYPSEEVNKLAAPIVPVMSLDRKSVV